MERTRNTRMKLQIVIPVINLWVKYTKPAIASVIASCEKAKIDYRIMLIDNNSTDETMEEASKLVSNTFAHYRCPIRMSFSESCNVGIRDGFNERFSDYVLILNNDVLLHEDCISKLLERISKEDVCLVSAMDVRGDCMKEGGFPSEQYERMRAMNRDEVEEAENPHFSAFMINKECYEKVGLFDEGFKPAYFEDNDYHYRINLAGLKAIVYPPAIFYHFGSRTQNEADPQPITSGAQFDINRAYYVTKWGGVPGEETFTTPFNKDMNNEST